MGAQRNDKINELRPGEVGTWTKWSQTRFYNDLGLKDRPERS